MGLTSRPLEFTMAVVAVGCVALTVWLWPRFAGRGVRALAGRLGTFVVAQVATVVALALAINTSFDFYSSWDDLFGYNDTAPAAVTPTVHGGRFAAVGLPRGALVQPGDPGGLDRVGLPAGSPAQVGKVESVRIVGRRTRAINPAFVYLPPQYFQAQYHRQRFPVVVAISGYPGGIMNLAQHLQLPRTAGRLIGSGAIPPTVVVMLRPTIAPPRDTECVDVPGGPQAETFFDEDLPDALKSAYRVGHAPSAWGAFGYSSGGTCALELAMRHPRTYTSAVALSPDYRVQNDLTTGNLFGGGTAARRRAESHDLMWRLRHLPAPPVSVLVASSRHGEKDYPATRAFLRAARLPMHADSIILDRGSHHFTTWRREVAAAVQWMGRQLVFPQDVTPDVHSAPHAHPLPPARPVRSAHARRARTGAAWPGSNGTP